MKRKQTRYETEQELLDEIDQAKAKIKALLECSVHEDQMAHNDIKEIALIEQRLGGDITPQARDRLTTEHYARSQSLKKHREDAIRMNKQRHTLEDVRLVKLKNALAAFNTQLMPYTEDRGVVLQ